MTRKLKKLTKLIREDVTQIVRNLMLTFLFLTMNLSCASAEKIGKIYDKALESNMMAHCMQHKEEKSGFLGTLGLAARQLGITSGYFPWNVLMFRTSRDDFFVTGYDTEEILERLLHLKVSRLSQKCPNSEQFSERCTGRSGAYGSKWEGHGTYYTSSKNYSGPLTVEYDGFDVGDANVNIIFNISDGLRAIVYNCFEVRALEIN
tara:strand:- start:197 stop:811 length:615 start_codon:yes stop_codon:yes gene_type:complete